MHRCGRSVRGQRVTHSHHPHNRSLLCPAMERGQHRESRRVSALPLGAPRLWRRQNHKCKIYSWDSRKPRAWAQRDPSPEPEGGLSGKALPRLASEQICIRFSWAEDMQEPQRSSEEVLGCWGWAVDQSVWNTRHEKEGHRCDGAGEARSDLSRVSTCLGRPMCMLCLHCLLLSWCGDNAHCTDEQVRE